MLSVVVILAVLALLFAVISIVPAVQTYNHYLLAVALILLSVAVLVGG
jgi:hypothetical protein